MSRVRGVGAVVVVCAALCGDIGSARADNIDANITQLSDSSFRIRLSAVSSLSRSHDKRAVFALLERVRNDDDANIRNAAISALAQMIDDRTPDTAREFASQVLGKAMKSDGDGSVRATAAKAIRTLGPVLAVKSRANAPAVFVNVDPTTDASNQMPSGAGDRIGKIVRQNIDSKGYATSWPGGLPTSAQLGSSRAFIVASTVKQIAITRTGGQAQIACTVAMRIAPWSGTDGGEKWEANKAASASGSAKAMTGNRDREIATGVRDCLEAAAEDVTARQVLPFLKRLTTP